MNKFKVFFLLIIIINVLLIVSPIKLSNIENTNDLIVNKEIKEDIIINIPYLIDDKKITDYTKEDKMIIINNLDYDDFKNYQNNDFFEENSFVYLTINNEEYKYRIFSVFLNQKINYSEEYLKFLNNLQNKSLFNINYNFAENDKIIILKTANNLVISGVLQKNS